MKKALTLLVFLASFGLFSFANADGVVFTVGPSTPLTIYPTGSNQTFYASSTSQTSASTGQLVYINYCFHLNNGNGSPAPVSVSVTSAPNSGLIFTVYTPTTVTSNSQYCGEATTTLSADIASATQYFPTFFVNGGYTGQLLTLNADDYIQISTVAQNIIDFGQDIDEATTSALFNLGASSTLTALAQSCSTAGNVFADALCSAGVYLFVPDPSILSEWGNFPSIVETKFPFSWLFGVQTDLGLQSASTTSNLPVMTFGLGDLGIGSTTPLGNILPNFAIFSTTTVTYFMPVGWWDTVQFLISVALWLELVYILVQDARRRFQHL